MPINATHFYHQSTRNIIVAFGTIFNNLRILREDGKTIKLPLQWGSKEKWYVRDEQDPGLKKMIAITLPRAGFVISDIKYDSQRKLNPIGNITSANPLSNTSVKSIFNSTPYNITIDMVVWTKTFDDALQILEQIIPYFNPDFNFTITELETPEVKRDITMMLNGVQLNDDSAEGTLDTVRLIELLFSFTIEANYFGPVRDQKIIKEVIINNHLDWSHPEAVTVRLTGVPDPINAEIDDSWVMAETWVENP